MTTTLADLTAQQREYLRTCVHESGHSVAAVLLGAELRNAVVVSARSGVQGLTAYFSNQFSGDPWSGDPRVSYAGPWSEARFLNGGQRPPARLVGAAFARSFKDERALSLAGGSHTGASVVPLLNRAWPAVMKGAQKLYAEGEVVHADVLAALGITDQGGPGSVQLASLRSGFRTVPSITRAIRKQRPAVP
jgi:hypothetical protein